MPVFKKRFSFSLGTTSFIFPEDWVGNARKLAPIVDEIELLVFESDPITGLPDPVAVECLRRIGKEMDVLYNVHLPTDVQFGSPDPAAARLACERIASVVQRMTSLDPTAWILHLDGLKGNESLEMWTHRMEEGLSMLQAAVGGPLRRICLETLDGPPEYLIPLVDRFQTGICLDIGHLLVHGRDAAAFFEAHRDRIDMIHVHGVQGERDHLSLDCLNAEQADVVCGILEHYAGHVSIEVFCESDFLRSLSWLEGHLAMRRPINKQNMIISGGNA
uniref:Sugar phosphate isomerase/epimerase n=1 Tax=Desulfatirhabdium butyrativorans TaxID=340467 RepID=A0A7C4MQK7_9BACT